MTVNNAVRLQVKIIGIILDHLIVPLKWGSSDIASLRVQIENNFGHYDLMLSKDNYNFVLLWTVTVHVMDLNKYVCLVQNKMITNILA